jgi:hypothetical protein
MFEHRDPSGNRFRTYEIDANDCELFEGDRLPLGHEIGTDIRSGMPTYLDFWGQVATVYYNPMNDSFLVMICRLSDDENEKYNVLSGEGLTSIPA